MMTHPDLPSQSRLFTHAGSIWMTYEYTVYSDLALGRRRCRIEERKARARLE